MLKTFTYVSVNNPSSQFNEREVNVLQQNATRVLLNVARFYCTLKKSYPHLRANGYIAEHVLNSHVKLVAIKP
jgi:hypothetical protein